MKNHLIKIIVTFFLLYVELGFGQNTLTALEQQQGFKLLWDGKTTNGWRGASLENFPEKGWKLQDGILSIEPTEGKGGDIVTTEAYANFELSVDFKLVEGGNSGIKYFIDPALVHSSLGLEYQLLDDDKHPDAKAGRDGNRTTASLYDLIPAPKDKVFKKIGEWNTAKIVSNGNHTEHWLNGVKVLEYERNSDEYKRLIALSKYKDLPNFGIGEKGRILLQNHGDQVFFRNIKIRQIPSLQQQSTFPIGFAIDPNLTKNDARYRQTIIEQASSITVANYMKPSRISPQKGVFNFEKADELIAFAHSENKRVHGHALVWYINTSPDWLKQIKDSTELENTLKNYIQTVGSHFKGNVASWDVVNEAFDNKNGAIRTEIQDKKGQSVLNLGGILGKDYVARMFQYAHQADPNALLFYNEYGQETTPKKLEAVLAMVTDFKRRSIPIAGLGLQMHINIDTPNAGIENALQKSAETGLLIHISELDIGMNGGKKKDFVVTQELLDKQQQKYKFVVSAYKRLVPAKQQFGITMWGVGDADSWIPGFCNCTDFPLLFDQNYANKPIYQGFLEGLK